MRILVFLAILLLSACTKEIGLQSFVEQQLPHPYECTEIFFVDSLRGYATGGDTWTFGYIISTHDGGSTWFTDTTSNAKIEDFFYDTIHQKGYACGLVGRVYQQFTHNNTWNLLHEDGIAYRSCWFMGDSLGVQVQGGGWSYGEIRRYSPFFWEKDTSFVTDNHLNDIWFVDHHTAVAVGIGYILYSNDAAATWQQLPHTGEYYVSVHFPTPQVGYIVTESGSVLRSEDGGQTWAARGAVHQPALTYHNVHQIFFVSQENGYIVGDGGIFSVTHDGGSTWRQVADVPDLDYTSIFVRANKGWVGTRNGKIFQFVE